LTSDKNYNHSGYMLKKLIKQQISGGG
jgi:hypothetical protein